MISRVLALAAMTAMGGEWSKPVEILVDETICATYRARFDGKDTLAIHVKLAPGWHTFAMDNQIRADEKLAGRNAIGMDRPTSFAVTGGLSVDDAWRQSEPKDFSKPELRIFTWGFENEAVFAVKALRQPAAGAARVAIRAQACTDSICKDITASADVELEGPAAPEPLAENLTPVRSK